MASKKKRERKRISKRTDPHEWWIYTMFFAEIYTFRKFSFSNHTTNSQWNRNMKRHISNKLAFCSNLPSTWNNKTYSNASQTIEIFSFHYYWWLRSTPWLFLYMVALFFVLSVPAKKKTTDKNSHSEKEIHQSNAIHITCLMSSMRE